MRKNSCKSKDTNGQAELTQPTSVDSVNLTCAGRAQLFSQLVHGESQDDQHIDGNGQCHAQAVNQERGDFRRTA